MGQGPSGVIGDPLQRLVQAPSPDEIHAAIGGRVVSAKAGSGARAASSLSTPT
jgi:hypothetical protein